MFKYKKVIGFIMFSFLVILNIYALDFSESHAKYVTDLENTISFNSSISKLKTTDVTIRLDEDNSDSETAYYSISFTRNDAFYIDSDTDIYDITFEDNGMCKIISVSPTSNKVSLTDYTAKMSYTKDNNPVDNKITFRISCDVSDNYATHEIDLEFNVKEQIINKGVDELESYTSLYYITFNRTYYYDPDVNLFETAYEVLQTIDQYSGNETLLTNYYKNAFDCTEDDINNCNIENSVFRANVENLKGFSFDINTKITTASYNDNFLGYATTWNYFQNTISPSQIYYFTTQVDSIRQAAFEYYIEEYGKLEYSDEDITAIKNYVNNRGGVNTLYSGGAIKGITINNYRNPFIIEINDDIMERIENSINPPSVAQVEIEGSEDSIWMDFITSIAEIENSNSTIATAVDDTYYDGPVDIFNSVTKNYRANPVNIYSDFYVVDVSGSPILLNIYSNSLDYVYGKIYLLNKGSQITIEYPLSDSVTKNKTVEEIINEIDETLYGDAKITIPDFNDEDYTVTTDAETGHIIYAITIDGIDLSFEVYSVDTIDYVKYTIRNS